MKKVLNFLQVIVAIITFSIIIADKAEQIFLGEDHIPGYIDISSSGDSLFYWLFRSRNNPKTDPIVFWLAGGPGCASGIAIFYENGPFHINNDLTLSKNLDSWNNVANLVYIDQPVGTGFSTASKYVRDEEQIAADFYKFLNEFLDKYPEYIQRPLYLTGESYAGHYIPAIATYITEKANHKVNFKGVAIGNGLVDPYHQYPAYITFAYDNGLINNVQYQLLKGTFALCDSLIKSGNWPLAVKKCKAAKAMILGRARAPRFNSYNIQEPCLHPPLCYNFHLINEFFSRPDVIKALGVERKSWSACSGPVEAALIHDWMNDSAYDITYLLEKGIFVFVYHGDKDFICNWIGGEKWLDSLDWPKKLDFQRANYQSWGIGGSYGEYKMVDNLTFAIVYDAGHMVPMDKPKVALYMFEKFLQNWKNA